MRGLPEGFGLLGFLPCPGARLSLVSSMRLPCLPILLSVLCFLALAGTSACAHHGYDHPGREVDEFDDEAFMAGLTHPFTGVDHLVGMLAVGVLAGRARRWVAVALAAAIGLAVVHGGAFPVLPSGIGLCLGTAAGVLLSAAVVRGLKGPLSVTTRQARATG